jgi:hypothetical protein
MDLVEYPVHFFDEVEFEGYKYARWLLGGGELEYGLLKRNR